MKQNKLFLGLATIAAAVLSFTSCSSDGTEFNSQQQKKANTITFTSVVNKTRATEDPQSSNKLSTSSQLAIWAINGSEALTNGNNEQYSVDGNGKLTPKTAANTMTWPDGATLDFYAYAPYSSSYTYNENNAFSVKTDQTSTANYLASDLVLAQNTNKTYTEGSPVELAFNHLMSKISVNITKAAGATVDLKYAKVSIVNTNTATTFNPSASESILGESSTPAEITLFQGDNTDEPSTVMGIMVPQTIAEATRLIKIQTNTNDASANRTLYAKLSSETVFESGMVYTLNVEIGDVSEPVSEVEIELGSASLVQWSDKEGSNTLGVTTDEVIAYGVGDYVLTDGTFVKASAYTSGTIAGIIFSTNVSTADAAAGYGAYIMGLNRKKMAFPVNTNYDTTSDETKTSTKAYGAQMGTGINNFADAFADYDGLTKTTTMTASSYYTSLTDDQKASFMGNLSWYTTAISGEVASSWYLPSFGQLIQILNNLGNAGISSDAISSIDSSNLVELTGVSTSTIATALQAKVTAANGTDNMFANGNIQYACSTENGSTANAHWGKAWQVKFNENGNVSVGKNLTRSNESNYSVIPVAAVKLSSGE